jgi:hypothetical protein
MNIHAESLKSLIPGLVNCYVKVHRTPFNGNSFTDQKELV